MCIIALWQERTTVSRYQTLVHAGMLSFAVTSLACPDPRLRSNAPARTTGSGQLLEVKILIIKKIQIESSVVQLYEALEMLLCSYNCTRLRLKVSHILFQ